MAATDFIYLLHEANFVELKRTATTFSAEDDPSTIRLLELWSERGELLRLLDEVSRLLHNFLASAKTLVDHTRVHVQDEHPGTAFERHYREEIQRRFAKSPVARFTHALRNYNLHYRIPLVDASLNVSLEAGGEVKRMTHSIQLKLDVLQEWDRWDALSKQYLSQAENLAVGTLADDYMGLITPFYEWFRNEDLQSHKTSSPDGT